MGYPSIRAQLERQRRDHDHFESLKKTDPAAARRLARRRLEGAGIMDENGEFTEDFLIAWAQSGK